MDFFAAAMELAFWRGTSTHSLARVRTTDGRIVLMRCALLALALSSLSSLSHLRSRQRGAVHGPVDALSRARERDVGVCVVCEGVTIVGSGKQTLVCLT